MSNFLHAEEFPFQEEFPLVAMLQFPIPPSITFFAGYYPSVMHGTTVTQYMLAYYIYHLSYRDNTFVRHRIILTLFLKHFAILDNLL